MGIFNKIKAKIAGAIEKSAISQISEDAKKDYEDEREKLNEKEELPVVVGSYSKNDFKDLNTLLKRVNAVDENEYWVGGYLKLRANQNAKAANLFTGKKALKFLSYKDTYFFMLYFDNNEIKSSKTFMLKHIKQAKLSKNLLELELHDKTRMNLEISENKKKVENMITLLSGN